MISRDSAPALVLGSNGYLGNKLLQSSSGVFKRLPVDRVTAASDLKRFAAQVREALAEQEGASLINCIGLRTGTDHDLHLINASIPAVLAEVSSDCLTHLIHIGSAAETLVPLPSVTLSLPVVTQMLGYGTSKFAGSTACLDFPMTTVLRVYNLHGLPHQNHSGLHKLCVAYSSFKKGVDTPALINTSRDYVDWMTVVNAVEEAVAVGPSGFSEVCSGVDVSIAQILEAIDDETAGALTDSLREADLFETVKGASPRSAISHEDSNSIAARLASEVLECASS